MNKNRLFLTACILLLSSHCLHAQCWIMTVDRGNYFSEIKDLSTAKDRILVQVGDKDRTKTIRKEDVVLVEYFEDGLDIIKKDMILATDPVAFDGDYSSFLAKGKRVYVPITSTNYRNQWGSKRLREMIMLDGYWKLAGCEEEADFILHYSFSDKGHDHARLIFSDRFGKDILVSKKDKASGWFAIQVAEESAEDLYRKFIKKGVQVGNYKAFGIKKK